MVSVRLSGTALCVGALQLYAMHILSRASIRVSSRPLMLRVTQCLRNGLVLRPRVCDGQIVRQLGAPCGAYLCSTLGHRKPDDSSPLANDSSWIPSSYVSKGLKCFQNLPQQSPSNPATAPAGIDGEATMLSIMPQPGRLLCLVEGKETRQRKKAQDADVACAAFVKHWSC